MVSEVIGLPGDDRAHAARGLDLEQGAIDGDCDLRIGRAEEWLQRPLFTPALAEVVRRLLNAADELYLRADAGIANLPSACRPGMYAARLLYAEIGHELRRRGLDSVNQRAIVPWQRKARILADACVAATRTGVVASAEVLEEARFLLASVPEGRQALVAGPDESPRERARWPRVEDRVIWLVDLFERLERRERAQAQAVNVS